MGDKRTQIVYDIDNIDDPSIIEELLEAETYLAFAPDTLAEAMAALEEGLKEWFEEQGIELRG